MNSTRELFDECLSAVPEDVAKDVDEYIEHLNASKPKVLAVIERGVDGSVDITAEYSPICPFGIFGQGLTLEDAKADFFNTYEEAKELYKQQHVWYDELEFEFAEAVYILVDWDDNYTGAVLGEDIAVVATGSTLVELTCNMEESLRLHLERMAEEGNEIPPRFANGYTLRYELTPRAVKHCEQCPELSD
jgi:predicted RNase H-like HicB family nuclease